MLTLRMDNGSSADITSGGEWLETLGVASCHHLSRPSVQATVFPVLLWTIIYSTSGHFKTRDLCNMASKRLERETSEDDGVNDTDTSAGPESGSRPVDGESVALR